MSDEPVISETDRYRLVAQLMERDAMTYQIELLPGRLMTLASIGKHLMALDGLLRASAKDVSGASLRALVNELDFKDNKIRIGLVLMHSSKKIKDSEKTSAPGGSSGSAL